jgi:uncharacterized membrane protein YoaK (UPF0700 family)
MTRYDVRHRVVAVCLTALAGFVDALAFLDLGGFFVSFMSGNSTRLGAGLANQGSAALIAGGLIAAFVAGACLGSLVGAAAGETRRAAVLASVALCLALAAVAHALGLHTVSVALMAIAMGAENAVFEEDGEVRIGLTYMTGTLVKLGQRLAQALRGGDRFGWLPHSLLWLGLLAGAVTGGLAYPRFGLDALWAAAAAAGILALVVARPISPVPPIR